MAHPMKLLMLGFSVTIASFLTSGGALALTPSEHGSATAENSAADTYLQVKKTPAKLRPFLQNFPKGADLHNHLVGAIYAESWLDWAVEDGLCVDIATNSLKIINEDTCENQGFETAASVRADEDKRREFVNALSVRSFVPYAGWSGHNQFFATFFKMASKPQRFGDMLAKVSERAGHQNIQYLELMHTIVLLEILPLVDGVEMTGDAEEDYKRLMASPFGSEVKNLAASIQSQIDTAFAHRNSLLNCGSDDASVGCGVELRLLHQVVRSFPLAAVNAQIILGWEMMENSDDVVGLNLVAPEDGYVALRDYMDHMEMIDHLYKNRSQQKITLHAGELTLGLVRPYQLRFHIREAIETGHALRIGHGIDLPYEDDHKGLLKVMRERNIPVEINLTSNDVILGVEGADHPLWLYRAAGVPYTLNTDDEGVSRIDLTHEYMRAVTTFDLPYEELKQVSRNGLTYSFLPGANLWDNKACQTDLRASDMKPGKRCKAFLDGSKKATLQWQLEQRLRAFEASFK